MPLVITVYEHPGQRDDRKRRGEEHVDRGDGVLGCAYPARAPAGHLSVSVWWWSPRS